MPLDISAINTRPDSRILGEHGEELAAKFLVRNGYTLVAANFRVPIGRNLNDAQVTGEIDIVALDGDVLCFVEVKTRTSDDFAEPSAAVNLRKQRQITRTARVYRHIFHIRDIDHRFDVVSVVLPTNGVPKIELHKAFWNES